MASVSEERLIRGMREVMVLEANKQPMFSVYNLSEVSCLIMLLLGVEAKSAEVVVKLLRVCCWLGDVFCGVLSLRSLLRLFFNSISWLFSLLRMCCLSSRLETKPSVGVRVLSLLYRIKLFYVYKNK